MNRITRFFIPAALVATATIMAGSCTPRQDRSATKTAVPVRVMTLQKAEGTTGRNYVGTVEADRTAVLSCNYSGTLRELRVSIGDRVSKGDTIAVIESQNVISAKQMADAVLQQAEDGYRRLSQVYESGSVAEVKMVEIQTQLSRAKASAQAAQKALDDCTVKAPFDGVIGEVFSEQGVEINAIEPIARLLDISEVEISFSVPEKEIGSISKDMDFTVEVPALDGAVFQAKVKSKGISASQLSHSYGCTLSPSGKIPGLMPGMVCKVYIQDKEAQNIVVPASTVRTDGSGRYVWTVNENGIVEKDYVTIGGFSGNGVIVLSGLEAGDRIITEGTQKVSSGMTVKVIE